MLATKRITLITVSLIKFVLEKLEASVDCAPTLEPLKELGIFR